MKLIRWTISLVALSSAALAAAADSAADQMKLVASKLANTAEQIGAHVSSLDSLAAGTHISASTNEVTIAAARLAHIGSILMHEADLIGSSQLIVEKDKPRYYSYL